METFYSIELMEQNNDYTQVNQGLRLGLILSDKMTIWKFNESYEFNEGDVFIINHQEPYRYSKGKEALCIVIHLPESYLKQYLTDFSDKLYMLDKAHLQDAIYKQIVNLIAKIGIVYIRKGEFYRLYIEQQLIELMFIIARFLPTKSNEIYRESIEDNRVAFVCNYIENNYSNSLTLNEVADKVHLSTAYLSKVFTRQVGLGFSQYITHIRLKHCKKDLVMTDESITQIAVKHGFSNSNTLLKHFKAHVKLTPSQFREKYKNIEAIETVETTNREQKEIIYQKYLHYLSLYIIQTDDMLLQSPEAQKIIDIRLQETSQILSSYDHVIQIGNLEVLLIKRFRKQLREVKNTIGINHILIRDPIKEGFVEHKWIESDEEIPNIHPYMKLDECLDFLIEHQIGLGIEINPPKTRVNFKGYYQEMTYLLEHMYNILIDRKSLDLVVYISTIDEQIFQSLVKLFKNYFPHVKIVMNIDNGSEKHVRAAKYILDYHRKEIDNIGFSANQNDMINFKSIDNNQYNQSKKYIILKLKQIKQWLGLKDHSTPFTLLKWNTLTGNTNYTNGAYFRADIIFEQLIEMNRDICMIGYWLNFEIHQQYCQKETVAQLHGIDLYHQFGSKRPAFFTSALFAKLSEHILYKNENCMVTGDFNHFQVIVWNAEHYNPYFTINDPSNDINYKEYQFNITNALPGMYKIKHYTLDQNHGALYKVWQQYNTRYGMDKETIDYVNRVTYPKLNISEIKVTNTINYHLKILTNAIQIIEFRKYFNEEA